MPTPFFYPARKFDLQPNLLQNFNKFQDSYNIFLSSLNPYISLIPINEINQDNALTRNTMFFDELAYASSIFNMDSDIYKYRGFVELKSVNFSINDVTIFQKIINGKILLTCASSYALEKISYFLQFGSPFILKVGYVDKIDNEINPEDYKEGMGIEPIECKVNNHYSEENNGVWNVTIEFIGSLFDPITRIPTKLFGNINYASLSTIEYIPKVTEKILKQFDEYEKNNQPSFFSSFLKAITENNNDKFIVKEEVSVVDFEKDYYVQFIEIFNLLQESVNSQYLKHNESEEKVFEFLYGNSKSTNLYKYSENECKSIDIIKHLDSTTAFYQDDVINKPPLIIPESPKLITIRYLSQIYVPLRYVIITWIKSKSFQIFIETILNWINTKYNTNLIFYVSYDSKYINIIHILEEDERIISENIPKLYKNSSKSIVNSSNLSSNTPMDTSYLLASYDMKSSVDDEVYLYNLNVIFDNIDIFNSGIFIPTQKTDSNINLEEPIKTIIKKYKLANKSERLELKRKYGNKLMFFKFNSGINKNSVSSNDYINKNEVSLLRNKGLFNNSLFFRPVKGSLNLIGNGFFEPMTDFRLYFDQNEEFIYNGAYTVESIEHSLEKNKWNSTLNVSRLKTFDYDVFNSGIPQIDEVIIESQWEEKDFWDANNIPWQVPDDSNRGFNP